MIFLADSFASFTEPEIGRAAIELLEMAGWDVQLAGDVCCGRALISKGLLDDARSTHVNLVAQLAPAASLGVPIVGCEPSCVFTLKDELPDLARGDPGAAVVAARARMVDDLLVEAIDDGSLTLATAPAGSRRLLFHAHCHQKAAGATAGSAELLKRLPGATVDVLDAGCCGMAGSFGFEREHYDLSLQIGGMRLFPAVAASAAETIIAATGVSCRQQIAHGTTRRAVHPVTLIREAVVSPTLPLGTT